MPREAPQFHQEGVQHGPQDGSGEAADFYSPRGLATDDSYIYVADSMKDKVIAKTKLIGGGESDTIEFAAPEPGVYDFICSFPNHAAVMKGKLTVK